MTTDPITVLEAAYNVDGDLASWLTQVATALLPFMDQGFGALAYCGSAFATPRFDPVIAVGGGEVQLNALYRFVPPVSDDFFSATMRAAPLVAWAMEVHARVPATSDEWRAVPELFEEIQRDDGYDDVLGFTLAPANGCVIQFTFAGRHRPLTDAELQLWTRFGAHVEAAHRLRNAAGATEAVLDPGGRLLHAEGEAREIAARDRLTHAAQVQERSRGRLRRESPLEAVAEWTALVSGRWSVVEQFESDGRRFLVARRNDATVGAPEPFTHRERQVADLVARGRSNKLVAYELGLAESTVSSALRSCLRKLGLKHRVELVTAMRGASAPKI